MEPASRIYCPVRRCHHMSVSIIVWANRDKPRSTSASKAANRPYFTKPDIFPGLLFVERSSVNVFQIEKATLCQDKSAVIRIGSQQMIALKERGRPARLWSPRPLQGITRPEEPRCPLWRPHSFDVRAGSWQSALPTGRAPKPAARTSGPRAGKRSGRYAFRPAPPPLATDN